MAQHQIVCTVQSAPARPGHGHIIEVGLNDRTRMSVAQVRRAISVGEIFYTYGPKSGRVALVEPFNCWCGIRTIKSAADAVPDNNLDNLPLCR